MIISVDGDSDINRLLVDKVFIDGEFKKGVVFIDFKKNLIKVFKVNNSAKSFYTESVDLLTEKIYGKITVVFKDKTGNTAVITSDNFRNGRIAC